MASGTIEKEYTVKKIKVTHENVASGASSTVTLSNAGLGPNDIIGQIEVSGSYNSEQTVWASYCTPEGALISRLRNESSATVTIEVTYTILHFL